ncbi:MAG: hypothetical protein JSR80_06890 [Verrucomicrobia bacterium]|nr:hypothetical protein [Verrucomicrobiota bacterium]
MKRQNQKPSQKPNQNQKQSQHTQRQVLRQARQEEQSSFAQQERKGQNIQEVNRPSEQEQEMRVEVEQQKMIRRPGPLKDRSGKGQKSIPPRRMH